MDPPSIETSLPAQKHFLATTPLHLPSPTLFSTHIPPSRNLHDSVGRKSKTPPPTFTSLIPVKRQIQISSTFFSPLSQMAAALLRSIFGNSQSTTPAHGKAKTRSRTESTPAPSLYYVYTPPQVNTPSTSSSLGKEHRTNSQNTPVVSSSPLRYPTYDSRRSHEPSRPPLYRAASHKHHPDMNGS